MCQLLILIGLPGSGKTTYSKFFKDRIIYDDFLNTLFNGNMIKDLKKGKKLIINDPRLCIKKVFLRTMLQLERVIKKKEICLMFMLVNIDQCRLNIAKRQFEGDTRNVSQNLEFLKTQYNLDNYDGYNKRFVL